MALDNDLMGDMRQIVQETLREEMRDLGQRIVDDVRQEMRLNKSVGHAAGLHAAVAQPLRVSGMATKIKPVKSGPRVAVLEGMSSMSDTVAGKIVHPPFAQPPLISAWEEEPNVAVNDSASKREAASKRQKSRMSVTSELAFSIETSRASRLTQTFHDAPVSHAFSRGDIFLVLRILNSRFCQCVKGELFDYAMGAVLLLNALEVGIQVNHMAGQNSADVPKVFTVLNVIFTSVFAFELISRAWAFHPNFWSLKGRDWKWNWFDTCVVVISILDEGASALLKGTEVEEAIDSVGVLRILRLARIVRLVRMVRLIPALRSMVYLMLASMASFAWTCVLLSVLMFCVSVYFTELTTDIRHRSKDRDFDMSGLQNYWGSIGQAVLSLFMAITGGDDWRNMLDIFNIPEGSYLLNAVIFSSYIAFGMLVMLNLVTGVFIEGAQRIIKEDKTMELIKCATKVFLEADIDSSAALNEREFMNLVHSQALDPFFDEIGVNASEAQKLFFVLDEDRSGEVTLVEFVKGCLNLNQTAKTADVAFMSYWQQVYYADTCESFKKMNRVVGSIQQDMLRIQEEVNLFNELCGCVDVNSHRPSNNGYDCRVSNFSEV